MSSQMNYNIHEDTQIHIWKYTQIILAGQTHKQYPSCTISRCRVLSGADEWNAQAQRGVTVSTLDTGTSHKGGNLSTGTVGLVWAVDLV